MAGRVLRRWVTDTLETPNAVRRMFNPSEMDAALVDYEATLLPNLQGFNTDRAKHKQFALPIRYALSVPIVSIANLSVKPGEPHFITWYFISAYFPLLSACLGPLANMISIIALIEHWRIDNTTGKTIPDETPFVVLNGLSLAMGIIGNVSLLMNFSGRVKYLVTQCISIFCWLCASVLLTIAIIVMNRAFLAQNSHYKRSEGFWMAVFTAFFYFCCSAILLINFLGYKLKKYPPTFNLSGKQRTLMVYTICFAVWCVVGSVVMSKLMGGISYGASLYYCIVSFLTIGLGDILPRTSGAKVMALILSLGGVLMMGLIVAMIRQVVLSSSGPTLFWHQLEKSRVELLQKIQDSGTHLTQEEAYREIRLLRKRAKMRQLNWSLLLTVSNFVMFWLVGAAVFHATEGWSYFNAVYFCFLCLITIGYGDFAPTTSLGRTFFVCWAVGAVPLMTILISNVGDKLFDYANQFSYQLSKWFFFEKYKKMRERRRKRQQETHEDDVEDSDDYDEEIDDEEMEDIVGSQDDDDDVGSLPFEHKTAVSTGFSKENWSSMRQKVVSHMEKQRNTYDNIGVLLTKLKPLISDMIEDLNKHYNHQEWKEIIGAITEEEHQALYENELFWLSERSPLRLPLKEPNYFIMKLFMKMEKDLNVLLDLGIEAKERFKMLDEGHDDTLQL